eukprot:21471-Heterococcus_DN1.PRE.2
MALQTTGLALVVNTCNCCNTVRHSYYCMRLQRTTQLLSAGARVSELALGASRSIADTTHLKRFLLLVHHLWLCHTAQSQFSGTALMLVFELVIMCTPVDGYYSIVQHLLALLRMSLSYAPVHALYTLVSDTLVALIQQLQQCSSDVKLTSSYGVQCEQAVRCVNTAMRSTSRKCCISLQRLLLVIKSGNDISTVYNALTTPSDHSSIAGQCQSQYTIGACAVSLLHFVETIVQRIMAEAAAAHANNDTYFSDSDTFSSYGSNKAEYEI